MEAVLTVRLDQETKNKGTKVMKDLGLTPSQAVRRLFDYTVSHDCLPFDLDPKQPHKNVSDQIAAFDRCHTKKPISLTDNEIRDARLKDNHALDA